MDSLILGEDIQVAYINTTGSRENIIKANKELTAHFPDFKERRRFGISTFDEQDIGFYKAAVEATVAESEALGLQTFTIKHGAYMSFYITEYSNDPDSIYDAFELLKGQQEADPNAHCIQWYIGADDVKCLVRSGPEDYPEPHL